MLPLVEPFTPCPVCAHPDPRPLHIMRNLRPIVQVPANVENLLQRDGWRVVRTQSGGFLRERSSTDAEQMMVLAVRDEAAASRPMRDDALAVAEEALRRYGRQL